MRKLILPKSIFFSYRCFLFLFGGLCYGGIEILWRGRTHPSMLLLGGFCFLLFSEIRRLPLLLPLRCLLCALAVTISEYLCGVIVNLWLDWRVWDYSKEVFSLQGQICLKYSLFWLALSLPGFFLCREFDLFCRFLFCHSQKVKLRKQQQLTISTQP